MTRFRPYCGSRVMKAVRKLTPEAREKCLERLGLILPPHPGLTLAMTRPNGPEVRLMTQRALAAGEAVPPLWELVDAIIISSSACEACRNVLGWKYGLPWGYPKHSEMWLRTKTSCDLCSGSGMLS